MFLWWGIVDFDEKQRYSSYMRLDQVLVQRNLYSTRARAVAAIKAGLVVVNGVVAKKPSQDVMDSAVIVAGDLPYSAGRGSLKLVRALDVFGINPMGMVCLDVGASTGGFTEVLLKRGATRVYAVDVGTNQLVDELRNDARVVSLTNIVDAIIPWGAKNIIVLIKPQFEVPREVAARSNGIIKSSEWHEWSKNQVVECFEQHGFVLGGMITSPIQGGSGNTEFLACFKK